jgi:hypothetical protein
MVDSGWAECAIAPLNIIPIAGSEKRQPVTCHTADAALSL